MLHQQLGDVRVSVPHRVMERRVVLVTWCVQQGSSQHQNLHYCLVTQVTRLMLEECNEVAGVSAFTT